ncbi:MAG TPA: site-specific integrase [Candidatus Paceibacterota bacterium]|nr:site-specific integrase [Verrucomicrobiota bacterium]HSA12492.1 site-specific integrase [Candidatus Paceibacterota bacterium]
MSLTLAVSSQIGGAEGAESTTNNNCSAETAAAEASRTGPTEAVSAPAPGPNDVLTVPVSGSSGAVATAVANGCVVKPKQFKAKVTERPGVDGAGPNWLVEVGSAHLKVYCTPNGDRELYTISYWIDRKRKRLVFPTWEKAIEEAKKLGGQMALGDMGVPQLSSADWAAYARARQLLDPVGVALETAAAEYADAVQKLAGRASLSAAVEFYLKRHPIGTQPKRVAEVVKECLESKRQDRLSARYLKQLEYDLNRFAAKFKNYLGDISGVTINDWLRSLDVSPRTRNNLRGSFQVLYSFAKAKRYVPKDHDELDAVALAKNLEGEIGIFRPDEFREVLAVARREMVPALVLGAFAGVRHAEIQRLDWQDIRMKAGIIEIRAAKAKTASRRTIPIMPNLKKWLKKYRKESGPVCPFANLTEQFLDLTVAVNERRSKKDVEGEFKWQHNGLRHSFISYRVAVVKNVAQVALEAGNSPAVIFSNYRELVTPQDAKAWFAIVPPARGKRAKGKGAA